MLTNEPVAPPPAPPPVVPPAPMPAESSGGCLSELGWMASAFVLPLASISFYRRAVRRSTGGAVLFFVVFMCLVSLVSTLGLTLQMGKLSSEIRRVFDQGIVPEITITGGVATVKGPPQVVLMDTNNVFVGIDVTGATSEIDQSRYTSGFLLTRTDLVVLSSSGQSQTIPLSQIQTAFRQDPLLINAETTAQFWAGFTGIFGVLALIGLVFWNVAVRFIYLAALALIMWGISRLFNPKVPYGAVLSLGVYAFVPVIYLIDIFSRVGRTFFLLQTLLLVIVWAIALYLALARDAAGNAREPRSLRAWRALLGLPLLAVMALDVIFAWRNGGYFVLLALALTLILLAVAGYLTRPRDEPNPGLPTGGAGIAP